MGKVVAISGPPGAGKSHLAAMVAQRLGATVVAYDRFETFTRNPPHVTLDWLARGAPYGELTAPGMEEALRRAARMGPVVLDSPLGRADPATGPLIDLSIWLTCPLDVALSRKISQLAGGVPAQQSSAFLGWLKAYLGYYDQIIRPACLFQEQRVEPVSDMALDACAPLADLVEAVLNRVSHPPRA